MIITSRMERRLSIAATALLTAAIFVLPIKTRAFNETPGPIQPTIRGLLTRRR